jgi:hypothetical protein
MYSTLMSPIFAGNSGTVFFCGMPTNAVGPVEDAMTPTFICANAVLATAARIRAETSDFMAALRTVLFVRRL